MFPADWTNVLIESIDGDVAHCFDLCYLMEVDCKLSSLIEAPADVLDRQIGLGIRGHNGTFTFRQLVEERRAAK